ncbi:MAG: Uma2 family endonuclease [Planctomycetota bacterium]
MATTVRRLTYDDYARIPPDGCRHEIIEGEEFMTPAPEVPHQRVSRKLERILDEYAVRTGAGEVFDAPIDVVLTNEDIVQPDLLLVSTQRAGIVGRENIRGAPDLIVEILSASTARIDRERKRALYERAGVREYWIVDPDTRTVEVQEFGSPRRVRIYKEGQSFESAIFQGLGVRLSDIF